MVRKLLIPALLVLFFPARAQNNMKYLMKAFSSQDSSDYYFKQAKKAIKTKADEAEYYFCKNARFTDYGIGDSAIYYGKIAVEKFLKLNKPNSAIQVKHNMSKVYKNQGQNDKATALLLDALKMAEKQKSELWISYIYSSLSVNCHDFEDYKKGVYYGKKAYHYNLGLANRNIGQITYALNSIAINFDDWNKPDSALYYHKKVFDYVKGKDTLQQSSTYNNIGNTLLKQKKFREAEKWIKRAIKISEATDKGVHDQGHYYVITTNYNNLATIAYHLGNYADAEKYFAISFDAAQKSNSVEKLRDYYHQQYQFNKKRGNVAAALDFQEEYLVLRDSVFKEERARLFGDLEAKYQNEKKEKALLLSKNKIAQNELQLKKKNTQFQILALISLALIVIAYLIYRQQRLKNRQQQQEFQLKSAIKEIETQNQLHEQRLSISRDLHDNIGAQLTFVISSVDNLKFGNQVKDEKVNGQLTKISDFTKSTIIELRDTIWAMNTAEFTFDDLRSRIFNFIEKAKIAKEDVEFSFHIQDRLKETKLSSIVGINTYRSIQEAVNNAIKHAQATKIEVAVTDQNGKIKISIRDNGQGFDQKAQANGNGLQNMEKRITDVGGKFLLHSVVNQGTEVQIIIG